MTKVKKLYCAIHQKWYNPSKGPCPLCESGQPGVSLEGDIGPSYDIPKEMQSNIFYIPTDAPEGMAIDPETIKLYQEQVKRSYEDTYRRIRLFRILNVIISIIFFI
jgi:hypothetical protein